MWGGQQSSAAHCRHQECQICQKIDAAANNVAIISSVSRGNSLLSQSKMSTPSTAWNLTLPLDQEHVYLEAQRRLARVCGGLAVSVATGNVARGVPSFVRAVRDYLRLRHDVTPDDLSNVCKVPFEACTMIDIDLLTQIRCAVVLTKA